MSRAPRWLQEGQGTRWPPVIPGGGAVSQAEPEMEKSNLALVLPRAATIYSFFPLKEGKKTQPQTLPTTALALFLSPPAQREAELPRRLRPAVPISLPICAHHMSITL